MPVEKFVYLDVGPWILGLIRFWQQNFPTIALVPISGNILDYGIEPRIKPLEVYT